MSKRLFGGTTQQIVLGLLAALMFIMAVEASQIGFGGLTGYGFFGWDDHGALGWHAATSITERDGTTRVRVHEKGCRVLLEEQGEVKFTDDERDFASLGAGASFKMQVRGCGDKFSVEAKGGGAAPALTVEIDGDPAAWDETAKGRLHDALQLVFDRTDYNAAGRVDRLFRRGGAAGVLEAVDRMASDSAQRTYLATLLGKNELTVAETARVWQLAGDKLGSDYELAELILAAPARHATEPEVRTELLRALHSLGSDYELRRTLEYLIGRDGAAYAGELIAVAGDKMSSDYDMAEFLIRAAGQLPAGAPLPASLEGALDSVNSDYELRRTLMAFVELPGLSRPDLDRLLKVASREISNDYEMTELLITVAQRQKSAEPWPPSVKEALARIASDHDEERAREALGEL